MPYVPIKPPGPRRRSKSAPTAVTVTGLKALPIVLFAFVSVAIGLASVLVFPALCVVALLILLGALPSPF